MENIKKIIASFLQDYKNEDYFIGAILTGSYATGNNDINRISGVLQMTLFHPTSAKFN